MHNFISKSLLTSSVCSNKNRKLTCEMPKDIKQTKSSLKSRLWLATIHHRKKYGSTYILPQSFAYRK